MSARWQNGGYQPSFPHEKEQLDSFPWRKIALEGLKNPTENPQQVVGQKPESNITERIAGEIGLAEMSVDG